MKSELFSWGGAEEVTGSKHFLRVDGDLIQVDCGAFQGRRVETDKKNRTWNYDADGVSAVVLTHAHYDHCGLLPLMSKRGFSGNMYATPATRDLANLILMDSAHIQAKDIEYLKKRAAKRNEQFNKQPLFTEREVVDCLTRFVTLSYHRPFHLNEGIYAEFYDAGHILGSAVTVLNIERSGASLSIAFSGDLGRKDLPILRDPEHIPPVDYMVMESTYGNRLHDPIESAAAKLAAVVNETVERNGKIIIPAFAVERTQELVYILHLLSDEGRIPKVPVYVDSPMATNATSIFRVHQECYDEETRRAFLDHHRNPFGFNELNYVVNTEESKRLNTLKGPAIIISASGMCESGRILHHLKNNIENPANTILVVGFMAQNTLGRRIVERQPEVKIFGDRYRLKARVTVLNAFSAHADYTGILEYLGKLDRKKLKRVFLVHGEPEAQSHLKSMLEEKDYAATIVRYGETYDLTPL
jgi:metallo-beta-lactamase family protein